MTPHDRSVVPDGAAGSHPLGVPADWMARRVSATRITAAGRESCQEWVIREERFDLFLNGDRLLALRCLPGDLEAYVVGFLASEGILACPYHVELAIDPDGRRIDARGPFRPSAVRDFHALRTLSSGCGSGQSGADPEAESQDPRPDASIILRRDTISAVVRTLQQESMLYRMTGGAHIAALADDQGKLLLTAEDIGRHAAVDKVIGKAILSAIDPARCVLFCSGRLAVEIVSKAIRARVPILVSRAAPTDEAIELARAHRLCLVGFARGSRMNVYSVPERIVD